MEYKTSYYNYMIDLENRDLLIYNFRTENKLIIPYHMVLVIKKLLNNPNKFDDEIKYYWNVLYEKEFIIDIDFDEIKWCYYKHNSALYRDDLLSVEILPTNDCNFRCAYCFERHESRYMNNESEEKVIKFLQKEIPKCKSFRLAWFGGEPLLCKDVVLRISREANELCKKYKVPMYGEMSTNGYLLDSKLLKELVSYRIIEYQICLDGLEEQHNFTRPHVERNDSFQVILNNLIDIKRNCAKGIYRIGIRCNVTPNVEQCLEQYLQMLSNEFGGDPRFFIVFQCVRDWGGEYIKKEYLVDSEIRIYSKWYPRAFSLGLAPATSNLLTPFVAYCPACRRNGYVIDSDASVKKCSLAMNTEYADINTIGCIDTYGRVNVDERKLSEWMVSLKMKKDCCECVMFPICMQDICFYNKNIKNNDSCNKYLFSIIDANLKYLNSVNKIPVLEEMLNEC